MGRLTTISAAANKEHAGKRELQAVAPCRSALLHTCPAMRAQQHMGPGLQAAIILTGHHCFYCVGQQPHTLQVAL